MLWTIMPESILVGETPPSAPMEYQYKNRKVLCCPMENHQLCIIRIISSNPKDYLDQRFQPGTIISESELTANKIL